tara:strand:- start:39 stop:488 length:450 start_codon:yes stop_codon:yes gene_type:complete
MSKTDNFNNLILEEFDDEESINIDFNDLNSESKNEDNIDYQNYDEYEDYEEYEAYEDYEEYEDYEDFEDFDTNTENSDSKLNLKNKLGIQSKNNLIPGIKIEIEKDENDEKSVKFSLNVIINEKTGETIAIDIKVTKNTYLMIAEELFN